MLHTPNAENGILTISITKIEILAINFNNQFGLDIYATIYPGTIKSINSATSLI